MTAGKILWYRLDNEARDLLLAEVKAAPSLREVAKITDSTYVLTRSDKSLGVWPGAWCGWAEMGMFGGPCHRVMESSLFALAEAMVAWKPRTEKGASTRMESLRRIVYTARTQCTIEGANDIKALIPIIDDGALS